MSQLLIRAFLGHARIDLPTHEEGPGQGKEGPGRCYHSYLLPSPAKEAEVAMASRTRSPDSDMGRFHQGAVSMAAAALGEMPVAGDAGRGPDRGDEVKMTCPHERYHPLC